MPSADAVWSHGQHTFTFGGSFGYTQLNARDERTDKGMVGFTDFSVFLQGNPITYTANGFITSAYLQGDANRHYRANDTGTYFQDKFQFRPNISLRTVAVRLSRRPDRERDGRLYNFDPSLYDYDAATDTIVSNGFIIAGNNKDFPTKGVSDSTLTGRQWGVSPRLGLAWSPKRFNNKIVVRAGWGMYYDRGELFHLPLAGFCGGRNSWRTVRCGAVASVREFADVQSVWIHDLSSPGFSNPWGPTLGPPPSGNPADIVVPNAAAISTGLPLFSFADYNRKNKLPYTLNQTLDIQWQPRHDLAIDIGYVGNLGRHEIVPLPFNQAQIASPTHPIRPRHAIRTGLHVRIFDC